MTTHNYAIKPKLSIRFLANQHNFDLNSGTDENLSDQQDIVLEGDATSAILRFTSRNSMSQDTGVFSIVIAPTDRWDRILKPLDLVQIKVHPGEGTPKNDNIQLGIISSVKQITSSENSVAYQVSGTSLMGALMNEKLGTINEAQKLLSQTGWMMGLGNLKSASSYLDGGSSGNNNLPEGEPVYAMGIVHQINFSTLDKKPFEGNKGVALVNDSLCNSPKMGSFIKIDGHDTPYKIVGYIKDADKDILSGLVKGKKENVMAVVDLQDASGIKKGENVSATITRDNAVDPSQNTSDKSTSIEANGLNLFGQSASSIARQILEWFLITHQRYEFGKDKLQLSNFIEMDLSSWEDEKLADPTPIMSFEGSLRQLLTDVTAKPFNEFFEDFKDGKFVFKMRKTPFHNKDWAKLDVITVPSDNIVESSLGKATDEVYSIFSAMMPSSAMISNMSDVLSYPVCFPKLIDNFGYNKLQVNNPYIFGLKKDTTNTGSSSGGGSSSSGGIANGKPITTEDIDKLCNADIGWDTKTMGNMSPDRFNDFIKSVRPDSPFVGNAKYFFEAGQDSGINPLVLMAFACLESAWGIEGMSHNYFGVGAFDNNPSNGHNYGSGTMATGIIAGAKFIRHDYYDAGQKTLHSFFNNNGVHQYSTTPTEDKRITSVMASYNAMFPDNVKKGLISSWLKLGGHDEEADKFEKDRHKETDAEKEEKAKEKKKELAEKDKKKVEADKQEVNADNSYNLKKYSIILANFFGDNISFRSGEIRFIGNPDFRVGNILRVVHNTDSVNNGFGGSVLTMEYYIESVSHEFNQNSGYTTTVGVTRGLSIALNRFDHHNIYEGGNFAKLDFSPAAPGNGGLIKFYGGFFGEATLDKSLKQADQDRNSSGSGSNNGGNKKTAGLSNNIKGVGKGDDYPGSGGPIDVDDGRTYLTRECTSFCSWRLSQMNKTGWKSLGNATTWGEKCGFPPSNEAKPGDIAWWSAGKIGSENGHVAYVAAVSGSKVTIEEYNYGYPLNHNYNAREIDVSDPSGYLRFPG